MSASNIEIMVILTYTFSAISGHPKVLKAAVLDVVTPDLVHGPQASTAEMLSVIDDCMNTFPGLSQHYQIHISHSLSQYNLTSQPSCLHFD